ncbi:MAG: pitrilysin family protein [Planctomycetota bacterium]
MWNSMLRRYVLASCVGLCSVAVAPLFAATPDAPTTPSAPDVTSAPSPAVNTPPPPPPTALETPAPQDVQETPEAMPDAAPFVTLQERDDRVVRVLPNRMILVAQRVPVAPVVSVHLWVKTGSLYEQEHIGAGLSHFLEHLLSGGTTTTRPEAESNALLASMGAQTNAATSLDTVRYYINTTREHSETAIDLLSDWIQNNAVLDSEYQRERDVIQREFSMGRGDPNRIFWKATQKARFAGTPDHPGAHPTIGYLDDFLTITRDELESFYRRMYVPNNMVLVVAGDIEPQRVIKQLTQLWQDVPTGELPELTFPIEPETAPAVEEVAYADIQTPRTRVFWRGVTLGSEHDFALDLAASILGQGESSRLVQSLREQQKLVTSVDAYNFSASWGDGFFGIDFQPAQGVTIEAARDAALTELDKLRTEPVTDEELARAKRKVLAGVLKTGQSAEAVAGRIASDIISTGDPDYLRRYADAIQNITAADLTAAMNAVVPEDGYSTVKLKPADEQNAVSAMDRPEQGFATSDLAPSRPFDLDNTRVIERLEAALATANDSASVIETDTPQVQTLDNGLTVIAQRSTVVPAVSMQMYTLGGLLADTPGREGLGNAAMSMLDRGAAGLTAQQLAAMLEDLGATLSTAAANNTNYLTASALEEDWPAVMAIMADVVLRPDFPEDEWQRLQPRLLAAIDRQDDRWSGELRRRFREAYFGGHPWSSTTLGQRDVVEAVTASDLRSVYFDRLAARDTVLVVVGDLEPSAVFAVAESMFGNMPAGRDAFQAPVATPPTPGLHIHDTGKPVTAVQVGFGPGVERNHPDYPALTVLSRVVSAFPSGWLEQQLRGEGPGLAYAVGAANVSGKIPGYFVALFNTSADSAEEALTRTMAVMERARTQPADDTTLAAAKARVLADEFRGRQTNASLAQGLALDHLYGVADADGSAFAEAVNAVTADDLIRVAQAYLIDPVAVVITQDAVDEDALRAILDGTFAPQATPEAQPTSAD